MTSGTVDDDFYKAIGRTVLGAFFVGIWASILILNLFVTAGECVDGLGNVVSCNFEDHQP